MSEFKKQYLVRGDRLRDLMLLVHLNNRYGLGTKMDDSRLAHFLNYSRTGLRTAIDESGYFVRKGDEIALSEKGERYVKKELLTPYRVINPVGYLLAFIGSLILLQWYLWNYHRTFLVLDWSVGLPLVVGGLVIRFAVLPMSYWLLKVMRKV